MTEQRKRQLVIGMVVISGLMIAVHLGLERYHGNLMKESEALAIGGLKTICAARYDINHSGPKSFIPELRIFHSGEHSGGVSFMDEALGKGVS